MLNSKYLFKNNLEILDIEHNNYDKQHFKDIL